VRIGLAVNLLLAAFIVKSMLLHYLRWLVVIGGAARRGSSRAAGAPRG
jgi:hypothetical protein